MDINLDSILFENGTATVWSEHRWLCNAESCGF